MRALTFFLKFLFRCSKIFCSLQHCFGIYFSSRLRDLGENRGGWGVLLIHIKHYLRLGSPELDPEIRAKKHVIYSRPAIRRKGVKKAG